MDKQIIHFSGGRVYITDYKIAPRGSINTRTHIGTGSKHSHSFQPPKRYEITIRGFLEGKTSSGLEDSELFCAGKDEVEIIQHLLKASRSCPKATYRFLRDTDAPNDLLEKYYKRIHDIHT